MLGRDFGRLLAGIILLRADGGALSPGREGLVKAVEFRWSELAIVALLRGAVLRLLLVLLVLVLRLLLLLRRLLRLLRLLLRL